MLRIREGSLNFTNAQQVATACGTHVPRHPDAAARACRTGAACASLCAHASAALVYVHATSCRSTRRPRCCGASSGRSRCAVCCCLSSVQLRGASVSVSQLFRCGRTLGLLTVVSALQSTVDGTWEIDKHYAQEVAGLSLRCAAARIRGLAAVFSGCGLFVSRCRFAAVSQPFPSHHGSVLTRARTAARQAGRVSPVAAGAGVDDGRLAGAGERPPTAERFSFKFA